MSQKFKTRWFYAGPQQIEKEVGLINKKKKVFLNERFVDLEQFSEYLETIYTELDTEGYDVVNVIPVNMGVSESCKQQGGAYVGDVGFSITRGAVIIGKWRG